MLRPSSSQTSTPLLPASADAVQTSHPSHLNCVELFTLVSWSPRTWYPSLRNCCANRSRRVDTPTLPSSRGCSVVTFAVPNFSLITFPSLSARSSFVCTGWARHSCPERDSRTKSSTDQALAPLISWPPSDALDPASLRCHIQGTGRICDPADTSQIGAGVPSSSKSPTAAAAVSSAAGGDGAEVEN